MMKFVRTPTVIPITAIFVLMIFNGFALEVRAGLIINGDFESNGGSLDGWTVDVLAGSDPISGFFAWDNATAPQSGYTITGPITGFFAIADQQNPTATTAVLRQSFAVPNNATSVTVGFQMFVDDQSLAGPFMDAAGLDHTTANPNQHARVDILTDAANPFSTAPADIVATLYLGVDNPGLLPPNPYVPYVFDLTGVVAPGTSYQIRFAEVNNVSNLQVGIDNVFVDATTAAVPEPSSLTCLLLAGVVAGFNRIRSRRKSNGTFGNGG